MHFWIDKRSQTCGFGRARVAASLGSGNMGLGFGTPPRRMISKPSAAIIHRQQQQQQSNGDSSSRAHSNNNNSSHNSSSNSNNNNHGTPIVTNSSNANNNNPNTRNNRNRSNHSNGSSPYQLHRQQQQSHHHNYDSAHQAARHYSGQQQQQQQHLQQPNQQHHNQHQRHHGNPADHHSPHNLPRATAQLLTVNNQDYHIPVALPYSYGGSSNSIDLEQGSMGIETLTMRTANMSANHQIDPSPADGHHVLAEVSTDVQLLPTHLKFGMCASLVLASVFIAGAKYYFDHQGGGMDALIFCAFLTISFLALCAISLCRYVPRDLTASPSISVDGHSRMLDMQHRGPDNGAGQHNSGSPHPQIYAQNVDQNGQDIQINTHSPVTNSIAAPPPPYHIAILLPPENGKEMPLDESPPPSYDKILI